MNARIALRIMSAALIFWGLAVYVAAKVHFFRHNGETGYLRAYSIYWILIASIGLVPLLIEKLSAEKPPK
jgi:hypothetical protein